MGALSEFLPLVLFFVTFKVFGIFAATGVAMATVAFQIGLRLARRQKIEPMLWVTAIVVAIFGGATLFFRDETFIKWKPTILYWCGAVALCVAHFGFKKNFIRDALGKNFAAPDALCEASSCAPLIASVDVGDTAPAATPVTTRFPEVPATLSDAPPVVAPTESWPVPGAPG